MEELSTTVITEEPTLQVVDRDLIKIFDKLNKTHFDSKICAGIGWRKIKPGKNSTNIGLCNIDERFIEISLILKDKRIPFWYVKYIVFHEMLHLIYGVGHSNKFLEHEKQYVDFIKADKYHQDKLQDIIDDWLDKYFV